MIVVDDGIATGSTMRAAIAALESQQPARLVVAVPTAAMETVRQLEHEVDSVVVLMTPTRFRAVGQWYEHFDQTSDAEVIRLLEAAQEPVEH